ncbi:MAG: NUDIX domain-containing protein [Firmicutes bacterium]|nr:NUDIX domain-containing protein [Bacillota bacterium]
MANRFKEPRPIVMGVAVRDGRMLVSRVLSSLTGEMYYRCIGGGIEFQERAEDALRREFYEETGLHIHVDGYLGLLENIFTFDERKVHELILYYQVSVPEDEYKPEYVHNEDGSLDIALWIPIEDVKNGRLKLYPGGPLKYL